MQQFWDDVQDSQLRAYYRDGVRDAKIAAAMGRTVQAIQSRRIALRLVNANPGGGTKNWTLEEDEIIVKGVERGLTDRLVADELTGRSADAVARRRAALGIFKNGVGYGSSVRRFDAVIRSILDGARVAKPTDDQSLKQAASVAHLIDLKRAGHSARFTEFTFPEHDGFEQFRIFRPELQARSYSGSQGAMCEGA